MECWFIWNARLSFWEAEFCCLLFTVLKCSAPLSSDRLLSAEMSWRKVKWEFRTSTKTRDTAILADCYTALISSFNIFSVSPVQDWFLSPLLSHVLKRLRQPASVFKIPLANLFSKLETKIASHDCKEGMWLWNGMFHYSGRGTGNFSPCLTLNSRDLKGPANRVSGYIVTLFESDLYFYICCIFQFIWYLFQLTQGRAADSWNWIIFLQSASKTKITTFQNF